MASYEPFEDKLKRCKSEVEERLLVWTKCAEMRESDGYQWYVVDNTTIQSPLDEDYAQMLTNMWVNMTATAWSDLYYMKPVRVGETYDQLVTECKSDDIFALTNRTIELRDAVGCARYLHHMVCEAIELYRRIIDKPLVVRLTIKPMNAGGRHFTWRHDDQVRRSLAAFLVAQPGLFIDMATMPDRPWKGMKFFHGANYQVQKKPSQGQREAAAPRCELNWEDKHTAYTSPYYNTSFIYGHITHTYRLTKDPMQLRLIDLRGERQYAGKTPGLHTGYALLRTYAGHKLGGETPDAHELVKLFEDENVDGVVFAKNIEWAWFKPAEVLEWDATCPLYLTSPDPAFNSFSGRRARNQLAKNFETFYPVDIDAQLSRLIQADATPISNPVRMQQNRIDEEDDLLRDEDDACNEDWKFATRRRSSQFVGSSSTPVWQTRLVHSLPRTYAIHYDTLMLGLWQGHFHDTLLGNVVVENDAYCRGGGNVNNAYNYIEKALVRLGITLLVTLPSGVVQLLPRQRQTVLPRVRPTMRGFAPPIEAEDERPSNRQKTSHQK